MAKLIDEQFPDPLPPHEIKLGGSVWASLAFGIGTILFIIFFAFGADNYIHCGNLLCRPTDTPTPTATNTATLPPPTSTDTQTPIPSPTNTSSPTITITNTPSHRTLTPTAIHTPSHTPSPTWVVRKTPTPTATPDDCCDCCCCEYGHYGIVVGENPQQLMEALNSVMRDGWIPLGGMTIQKYYDVNENFETIERFEFYQAIVKCEE